MKLHFRYENGYWWAKIDRTQKYFISCSTTIFACYQEAVKRKYARLVDRYVENGKYRGPK